MIVPLPALELNVLATILKPVIFSGNLFMSHACMDNNYKYKMCILCGYQPFHAKPLVFMSILICSHQTVVSYLNPTTWNYLLVCETHMVTLLRWLLIFQKDYHLTSRHPIIMLVLWNDLPETVYHASSLVTSRRLCKTILFQKASLNSWCCFMGFEYSYIYMNIFVHFSLF